MHSLCMIQSRRHRSTNTSYCRQLMDQRNTICLFVSADPIHNILHESGGTASVCKTTFPAAFLMRSIFCHDMHRLSPVSANVFRTLTPTHTCKKNTHNNTHTLRFPAAPIVTCEMIGYYKMWTKISSYRTT